jgi:hypothetical protein
MNAHLQFVTSCNVNRKVDPATKAAQAVRSATAKTRGVEWATGRGVVAHCTRFSRSVLIRWEGRKSMDIWPVEAVEKLS